MTSHAPMATEALCAMGRPEAVLPWLEGYLPGVLPWPAEVAPIGDDWREALGQEARASDWKALFEAELAAESWPAVLDRWTARLAPGFSGAATHGIIRVGHAVRSLAERETAPRLGELAGALASWAATYSELPTDLAAPSRALPPSEAIRAVTVVPPERRVFTGSITSSLAALGAHPEFAGVIGLIDVSGDPAETIAALTETFAQAYLANAHDGLTSIVFIHGVTSTAAVGHLLPFIGEETARTTLRHAWQAGCALYAAFGSTPAPEWIEAPQEDAEMLIDLAVAHGDDHATKFTEACTTLYGANPSPAYLAAVGHAQQILPPARKARAA